jgi:hypothetical protein
MKKKKERWEATNEGKEGRKEGREGEKGIAIYLFRIIIYDPLSLFIFYTY